MTFLLDSVHEREKERERKRARKRDKWGLKGEGGQHT